MVLVFRTNSKNTLIRERKVEADWKHIVAFEQ
jgi:hypothetical protein